MFPSEILAVTTHPGMEAVGRHKGTVGGCERGRSGMRVSAGLAVVMRGWRHGLGGRRRWMRASGCTRPSWLVWRAHIGLAGAYGTSSRA